MKLLIVSDSHGAAPRLEQALERERPDVLIHLGDGWQDARSLLERCPCLMAAAGEEEIEAAAAQGKTALLQVPGNCDVRPEDPPQRCLSLCGCRLLVCHGHTYGVKTGLQAAWETAQRLELDGFFFGHTHRPLVQRQGRTLFVNPGSIGQSLRPTYAVVQAQAGRLEGQIAAL